MEGNAVKLNDFLSMRYKRFPRVIYFGDEYHNDIYLARLAGWEAVVLIEDLTCTHDYK